MLLLIWMFNVGVLAEVITTKNEINISAENIHNITTTNNILNGKALVKDSNIVTTENGKVQGIRRDSGIWQFFDIPYGAFDIDNPFQPPTTAEPWTTTRHESEHRSICPQILQNTGSYSGNEDCLTLTIFTPSAPSNNDVLFHIHDGEFSHGSGDPNIYGPEYLVPKGIILVLPNYRLGPLGFLCFQNKTAPGNAGLKDLTLALNWTKSNIAAFGGNPSNIVVSGSGHAAAIVEYLLLSEKSQEYISKAITESGSILSHWAFDRFPLKTAAIFDEKMVNKVKISESQPVRNLFGDISLEDLIEVSNGIIFKPCIEKDDLGFITTTPTSLLRRLNSNITYMTGSASHAGLKKALEHTKESILVLNENYTLLLPDDLQFDSEEKLLEIGNQVKMQYFEHNDITTEDIEKLSLCYTDNGFLSPGLRGARSFVSAGVDIYYYEFSYMNPQSPTYFTSKCGQGNSLNYVFSKDTVFEQDTKDYHMMSIMTDLWSNFIRNGQPTLDGIKWNKFGATDADKEIWLSIGQEVEIKQGLHRDRLKLWDEIYKNYFFDRSLSNQLKPSIYTFGTLLISYNYRFL